MHALFGCSRRVFCAVVTLLMPLTAASAAVRVVDCVNGPFTTIGAAVAAAEAGDTVLVERCELGPYPPFDVTSKSDLHIVGNGGRGVIPIGLPNRDFRPEVEIADDPDQVSFACADIANSDNITLTGFTFGRCGFHAVNIGSAENVRVMGNRFGASFETVRDSTNSGSQIVGNLFVGGAFAVFVDGSDALVSQNLIIGNQGSGISVLSPGASGNQIVSNIIRGSALEAIFTAADSTRIERNVCDDNGGLAEIVLSSNSSNSTVVGNITGDSISDGGSDNVLVGNQ